MYIISNASISSIARAVKDRAIRGLLEKSYFPKLDILDLFIGNKIKTITNK